MYRVETDDTVARQLDQLPSVALIAFAELRVVLELDPWTGEPVNDDNPQGAVRTKTFGEHHQGFVAYLILDHTREVHLLQVTWLG